MISTSAPLLLTAVFIKLLLVKFRINKIVLLSAAAIILFIATHSITFSFILLLYGYLVKFLFQKPVVEVSDKGITIKRSLASPIYQWRKFANVILKDGLLTLDFEDNKLLQLSIDENSTTVEENTFNDYCKGMMK